MTKASGTHFLPLVSQFFTFYFSVVGLLYPLKIEVAKNIEKDLTVWLQTMPDYSNCIEWFRWLILAIGSKGTLRFRLLLRFAPRESKNPYSAWY